MQSLYEDRRGLSQVVTTLIILVVSVLLAGVVTYYATNVVMTRTAQEDLKITNAHCWVNSTDSAEVAFVIKNVGGLDVLMDKIAIRGIEVDWTNVYYNSTAPANELEFINYTALGTNLTDQADRDIPLESGGVKTIYIKSPGEIELSDVGTTVSITVFTVNGQWIKEVNVEYAGS